MLPQITSPIVVFVDEIDQTLKLQYTDDFFLAIRAMHNDRARNPDNRRLTFVLVGVARPADLVKDHRSTPYNIGLNIPLYPVKGYSVTVPVTDSNRRSWIRYHYITVGLIVLCIVMFVVQFAGGEDGYARLVYALGTIPSVLFGIAAGPSVNRQATYEETLSVLIF